MNVYLYELCCLVINLGHAELYELFYCLLSCDEFIYSSVCRKSMVFMLRVAVCLCK